MCNLMALYRERKREEKEEGKKEREKDGKGGQRERMVCRGCMNMASIIVEHFVLPLNVQDT